MAIKNARFRNILLIICFIVIGVAIFVVVRAYLSAPLEVKTLDVRFRVSDRLGFEFNTSALSFGVTFPGTIVSKKIDLDNMRDFPVRIEAYASPDVDPYLTMDNETILQSGEKAQLGFVLSLPENMSFGNYTGQVVLKIYRYRPA